MGKSILCESLVSILPPDCPVRIQCAVLKSTCQFVNKIIVTPDSCPEPCYGGPCSCEINLDGGKLESYGLMQAKAKEKKKPKGKKK